MEDDGHAELALASSANFAGTSSVLSSSALNDLILARASVSDFATGLSLLALDHLVDQDAVLELLAAALLAEGELLEVLFDRLRRVGRARHRLHELGLAGLAVGVGHDVALGLRLCDKHILDYERLYDLVLRHLAEVCALGLGDLVSLRLHDSIHIGGNLALHERLAIHRDRHGIGFGLLGLARIFAASGDHRPGENRRTKRLDVHFLFLFLH